MALEAHQHAVDKMNRTDQYKRYQFRVMSASPRADIVNAAACDQLENVDDKIPGAFTNSPMSVRLDLGFYILVMIALLVSSYVFSFPPDAIRCCRAEYGQPPTMDDGSNAMFQISSDTTEEPLLRPVSLEKGSSGLRGSFEAEVCRF